MFNKNDYAILSHIYHNNYNSPVNSITTLELIDESELSSSKVRNTINEFIRSGYIIEGLKDGNNKTYYISESGTKHFEDMFGKCVLNKDNKED
ncbi:winged helix-turn-helix domain-containing protein [Clostridium botulinum]|nr:winged helix-turn-helix domain-containing protein [Clostridium botulinum]